MSEGNDIEVSAKQAHAMANAASKRLIFERIKRASSEGLRKVSFHNLNEEDVTNLQRLGYKVAFGYDNAIVSW